MSIWWCSRLSISKLQPEKAAGFHMCRYLYIILKYTLHSAHPHHLFKIKIHAQLNILKQPPQKLDVAAASIKNVFVLASAKRPRKQNLKWFKIQMYCMCANRMYLCICCCCPFGWHLTFCLSSNYFKTDT